MSRFYEKKIPRTSLTQFRRFNSRKSLIPSTGSKQFSVLFPYFFVFFFYLLYERPNFCWFFRSRDAQKKGQKFPRSHFWRIFHVSFKWYKVCCTYKVAYKNFLLTGHALVMSLQVFQRIRARISELRCWRGDAAILLLIAPAEKKKY